jgi:GT2 family glycosyltransferase
VPANPRITLIITTYNWPAALDLTLRSVARQSRLPDEVIIAAIRRSCPTINPALPADQRGNSRNS